ncbi:LacI family DNA-binding transcriptional regulator [Halonatronum saccharophilum]|uniref:LacI family DNA-binding transcriptional regulator n=1 Tax=Halonatronum saccharophilum TaxID=150060 RepID=UPI0004AC5DF1|nr:LacI family DNA-binding transcriptional regulator [Halonatronum saccharophilum]
MKRNKLNIYKIAEIAGVSKSTVSRVINDKAGVGDKTRKKVLEIIKDLNYQPNSFARGLANNKTKTIGLVVSDITDPFFSGFIKGVEAKAMEDNYNIMLANSHWVVEEELKCVKMFQEGRVDGVLIISGARDGLDVYLNDLSAKNTPVLLIDRKTDNGSIPKINVDNFSGAYMGVKYLLDLGHKKVACIKGDDVASSGASVDRVLGYKKALNDFGINNEIIVPGYFEVEDAYKATHNLLEEQKDITAIFYLSDMMAIGGLKAIRERGLKVPDDISVLGCDDIELASLINPPLTTLRQPRYEMGYKGMGALISILEETNKRINHKDISFNMELVIRESTKKVNIVD